MTEQTIPRPPFKVTGIAPINNCPQPDAPELVMRANGYHYRTENEMTVDPTTRTYEQEHAIKEGHRDKAEDDYFNARPQVDIKINHVYFKAGFDRGWDAAKNDSPPAEQPGEQEPVCYIHLDQLAFLKNRHQDDSSACVRYANGFPTWVPQNIRDEYLPLYTHPAPSLATLRAKVMMQTRLRDLHAREWVELTDVLAEIDKLGGGA